MNSASFTNMITCIIIHFLLCRYSPSYDGRSYMKECCAKFLSSYVFNAPVVPEDIIVVDGSGAVMDIMGTALLNPSIDGKPADAFICITPCYNAFNNNFTLRNDAVMYKADITATKYFSLSSLMVVTSLPKRSWRRPTKKL